MLVPIYCISGIPLYFPDMFDCRPHSPANRLTFVCAESVGRTCQPETPQSKAVARIRPPAALAPIPLIDCNCTSGQFAVLASEACCGAEPNEHIVCRGWLVRAKIRFTIRSTSTTFVQNLRKQSWRLRCPVIDRRFAQRPTSNYSAHICSTCEQHKKTNDRRSQAKTSKLQHAQ